MAAIVKGLFGGSKPSASAVPSGDSDPFDSFEAPDPSPAAFSAIPSAQSFTGASAAPTGRVVPWTKWYNVHERHSLSDFKVEGIIFIALGIILAVHLLGTRANRAKAKKWIDAHAPSLQKEFALVGFGGPQRPSADDVESEGLLNASANSGSTGRPVQLLKEKSLNEFSTYASGRQNVAFADIQLTLIKRYNPLTTVMESGLSFFFDSIPAVTEKMEAIIYPFDGREAQSVPSLQIPGALELKAKDLKSSYDNFVWAVVNKDCMKSLRDDRYDVSITTTKDNSKLPNWATVMSEAAEITDLLLTPELVKCIEQAGELMEYIIITDQPIDKPTKINETTPKKRIYFSMRLPSNGSYTSTLPLFEHVLRLPDQLATSAHFRPEVQRKIKAPREDMIRRLQKADEDEKAEERAAERDKAKKVKRDLELKGLDAKAQKKYLEKEREKEMRKATKKQTTRA